MAMELSRDAFLEAWAATGKYGTMEELKQCYQTAQPFSELVQAARYSEEAESMEGHPRSELVGMAATALGSYHISLEEHGVFRSD